MSYRRREGEGRKEVGAQLTMAESSLVVDPEIAGIPTEDSAPRVCNALAVVAIVAGGDIVQEIVGVPPGVEVYPLLVGEARRCLLKGARLWVGRTGQTTLMDLWATRACGVLVPTPGMTEQIHLAEMVREWDHRPEPGRDTELAMPFLDALPGSVYFDGRRLPPPLLAWSTRDSVQVFLEGLGEVVREAAGVDRHPYGVRSNNPESPPERVGG